VKKYSLFYVSILLLFCFRLNAENQSEGRIENKSAIEWKSIGYGAGGGVNDIAVDPREPDRIFVVWDTKGLHRSLDGGKTWQPVGCGSVGNGIVFDPVMRDIIYCYGDGVYKSTDGGLNWLPVLKGFQVHSLAVSPEDSGGIFAGVDNWNTGGGLLRTSNGGTCWQSVSGIPVDAGVRGIAFHPSLQKLMYAATTKGFFMSSDKGAHWKKTGKGLPHDRLTGLAVVKEKKGYDVSLYASLSLKNIQGSLKGGVYKSVDSGENWFEITKRLNEGKKVKQGTDYSMAVDPLNSGVLYVAVRNINHVLGFYKTVDSGASWIKIADKKNVDYAWSRPGEQFFPLGKKISICDSSPNVIYEGGAYAMHKSMDGGESWTQIYADQTPQGCWKTRGADAVHVYDIDIARNNELYITADDAGIWKSSDKGESFDCLLKRWNVFSLSLDPDDSNVLYIGESMKSSSAPGILKKSSDGGKTWKIVLSKANGGAPEASWRWKILIDKDSPLEKRTVYAANAYWYKRKGTGIYKSIDGGATWKKINNGLHNLNVIDIAIDAKDHKILYAAIGVPGKNMGAYKSAYDGPLGGVYKSCDGGENWTKLNKNIEIPNCLQVVQDSANPTVFYLAAAIYSDGKTVYPGGVYVSEDCGENWRLMFKQPCISSIAIDKKSGAVYVASTVSCIGVFLVPHRATDAKPGIYRTLDKGKTWTDVSGDIMKISPAIYDIEVDPDVPGCLYAGTSAGCIQGLDKEMGNLRK
jgi:photosystem II stability/assembly factor-like uncharacterized protein